MEIVSDKSWQNHGYIMIKHGKRSYDRRHGMDCKQFCYVCVFPMKHEEIVNGRTIFDPKYLQESQAVWET